MVENCLYCLMTWLKSQSEIEILLWSSVPHHIQTLDVPGGLYGAMLDAAIDVIVATVPADEANERAVIEEIRTGIDTTIQAIVADYAPLAA